MQPIDFNMVCAKKKPYFNWEKFSDFVLITINEMQCDLFAKLQSEWFSYSFFFIWWLNVLEQWLKMSSSLKLPLHFQFIHANIAHFIVAIRWARIFTWRARFFRLNMNVLNIKIRLLDAWNRGMAKTGINGGIMRSVLEISGEKRIIE